MSRYFILSLILLSSCASQLKKEELTSKYINSVPERLPSHYEIKSILSRDISMAGGDYQVVAYPYTKALIKAMVNDLTHERGLTESDTKKLTKTLEKSYLNNKVCFHVDSSVLRFEKAAELKNWKIKVIDNNKKEYPLTWLNSKTPIKTQKRKAGDKLIAWLNEATACSDQKVSLNDSFYLEVAATYAPFPFSTSSMLYWQVYTAEEINDPKIMEKKKENDPRYKGYRGW
jgi:hypothetical protein